MTFWTGLKEFCLLPVLGTMYLMLLIRDVFAGLLRDKELADDDD